MQWKSWRVELYVRSTWAVLLRGLTDVAFRDPSQLNLVSGYHVDAKG